MLHKAWLEPDLLCNILLRQLWFRLRKYPNALAAQNKLVAMAVLSVDTALYLTESLRPQIDTFAVLEDTQQDRACAPIGAD